MKKLFNLLLLLLLFSCSHSFCPWCFQTPDEVFKKWHYYAMKRNYKKMFRFEYFQISNVIFSYHSLNPDRKWKNISEKEQQRFINQYKNALQELLDKKKDNQYQVLLRLKKEYNIKAVRYSVNIPQSVAELWVVGDYPGVEKIRLIMIKKKWYLINPFGYHSYISVLKKMTIEKASKKK